MLCNDLIFSRKKENRGKKEERNEGKQERRKEGRREGGREGKKTALSLCLSFLVPIFRVAVKITFLNTHIL